MSRSWRNVKVEFGYEKKVELDWRRKFCTYIHVGT